MKNEDSLHETMENTWWQISQEMDSNPPFELFHYTDLNALCGISMEDELWATNIEFLNDYKEFYYGLNLVHDLVKELEKEDLSAAQREFLKPFREGSVPSFNEQIFIVSLSEYRDRLSQWRGYGSKNQSVCIGFKTSQLKVYGTSEPYSTIQLVKVIYELDEQKRMIYEFFANYLYGIKDMTADEAREKHEIKYIGLLMLLVKFKDPSWSEEGEWRLICSGIEFDENHTIKRRKRFYRPGNAHLSPYVKIKPFAENYFSSITLPMNSFFNRNKFSVINLLGDSNKNPMDITIIPSSIPIVY